MISKLKILHYESSSIRRMKQTFNKESETLRSSHGLFQESEQWRNDAKRRAKREERQGEGALYCPLSPIPSLFIHSPLFALRASFRVAPPLSEEQATVLEVEMPSFPSLLYSAPSFFQLPFIVHLRFSSLPLQCAFVFQASLYSGPSFFKLPLIVRLRFSSLPL